MVDTSSQNSPTKRIQTFVGELKRRKVFQVTSVYLVAAWGLSAGAADIFEVLGFPPWASRYFVIGLFSMTPVVIVVAWVFELSKSGIQRDLGPSAPSDQTTVLASRRGSPILTANWLGRQYSFAGDFIVGRDDSCALQIVDPMISRQHAKLSVINGRWRIEDLGSANGIELDGQKQSSAWLTPNSTVRFYPDGPTLKLTVGITTGAETVMAKR